jgi:hypothetical protein
LQIIIDFDGTLTAEERQALPLSERSLDTLSNEVIDVSRRKLAREYRRTQARLLQAPHAYWWEVNGLIASYCNEGAFILNTTTLQVMLRENETYLQAVTEAYPNAEYGPVVDCTNDLFHRHTAEFSPAFRPAARDVLATLAERPDRTPIILTNSLGEKVRRHLGSLALEVEIAVLGDTRQYEMAPEWKQQFIHPELGKIQIWPAHDTYQVDLRRPAYFRALAEAAAAGQVAVVADTFSMPGALPLMMGIPFFLLCTPYTPPWCIEAVMSHPLGGVLDDLADLLGALDDLPGTEKIYRG